MTDLDEVHRSHLRERETLESDIVTSEKAIDTCGTCVKDLEERYRFFQEMRGYVRDLVHCLNEKVGLYLHILGSQCDNLGWKASTSGTY